jgi:SAM-dependent methyltransferase
MQNTNVSDTVSNTLDAMGPSEGFDYYTGLVYWNDFESVNNHFNCTISGSEDGDWYHYLREHFGTFQCGFFINCGNGWVERELFKVGVIKEAIGIDFSEKKIAEAIQGAQKIDMPARYFATDCNTFKPDGLVVDLVVNHAAMHHVAYINKLTYNIARMLGVNGQYVAFDYVGAHRNQYSWPMWSAIIEFNETLPERYRANLIYPHMATMLHNDPTEAIHSEIQISVLKRYFDIETYCALGGPIAYHILFENLALYNERETPEGIATIERILEADINFTKQNPDVNLFAFWIAKPKVENFPTQAQINEWQLEENDREIAAIQNGGRYYAKSVLETIYNDRHTTIEQKLASTKHELAASQHELFSLQNKLKMIEASMSWSITAPLRAIKKNFR